MAQRFGRNRRRAAREALAQSQAETATVQEVAHKLSDKLYASRLEVRDLADQIDYIATELIRSFGSEAAFLPLERTRGVTGHDIRRWPVHTKMLLAAIGPESAAMSMMDTIPVVDLMRLVAELELSPERHQLRIRFKDTNHNREFEEKALYLSLEEYRMRKLGADGVRYLLRHVEQQFIAALS